MSILLAILRQHDDNLNVYYDMILDKVSYGSGICHNVNKSIHTSIDVALGWASYNSSSGVIKQNASKMFIEMYDWNTADPKHTSMYCLFPQKTYWSRASKQTSKVFIYSDAFISKENAIEHIIGGIFDELHRVVKHGTQIPYEDFEHHLVMSCAEFDTYILDYARKQVINYHCTLMQPLLKNLELSNDTNNSLQKQISRLEDRLHDLEMNQQDESDSDTSSIQSLSEDNEESEITLTPSNIVDFAIEYYKQHNLNNADIIDTIQSMLGSQNYKLGKEITQKKLDFTEANTMFLTSVAPAKLDRNDLQNLIFKNVVCNTLL